MKKKVVSLLLAARHDNCCTRRMRFLQQILFLRRIHRRRFHQRNFRFCFHRRRKKDAAGEKIAMITDSGDITDESFNQITWETVCAYGDANGVEYEYYKPAEDTDEERINSIDLAVSEGATVVVMPGYLFGPAIAEEQDTYPDVTFIAVDVTEGDIVKNGKAVDLGKNVYICSFEEEQAGYLAGYAAVKDGYTSLGFLGGIAVPAVIRFGYGFMYRVSTLLLKKTA